VRETLMDRTMGLMRQRFFFGGCESGGECLGWVLECAVRHNGLGGVYVMISFVLRATSSLGRARYRNALVLGAIGFVIEIGFRCQRRLWNSEVDVLGAVPCLFRVPPFHPSSI
jgi:hypothetical protein